MRANQTDLTIRLQRQEARYLRIALHAHATAYPGGCARSIARRVPPIVQQRTAVLLALTWMEAREVRGAVTNAVIRSYDAADRNVFAALRGALRKQVNNAAYRTLSIAQCGAPERSPLDRAFDLVDEGGAQ